MRVTSKLNRLPSSEWNRARARHLLNRAGFGVPIHEVDRLAGMTLSGAVDQFLLYDQAPETAPQPDFLDPPNALRLKIGELNSLSAFNARGREATEAERTQLQQGIQKARNDFNREQRQDLTRLKGWWLRRMLGTRRPLQEKMTLFWHGHFAVSAQKVRPAAQNYQLNQLFRERATGNFKNLTHAVGQTPAMLIYLDQSQSNRRKPNENWARELMELFTMGVGNYTEEDIKNSARAFTGWSNDTEKFIYRRPRHDTGVKEFLGRRGKLTGNDILDIIFEQDVTAEFIAAKLWKFFASEDPDPEVVAGLAETLRTHSYELQPMLRQMFESEAFYAEEAIGRQIKSPVQLVVGMISQLGVVMDEPIQDYVLTAMRAMGQDLFHPPNVKGWDGGRAWINPDTLVTRYNLANFLVQGVVANATDQASLRRIIGQRDRQMQMDVRQRRRGMQVRRTMTDVPEMNAGVGLVGDRDGAKGVKLAGAPFSAPEFFANIAGSTILQTVDTLADYFYGGPLRDDQRGIVVESLSGAQAPAARLDPASWDVQRLYGTVHLMLSAAEYQLC